MDHTAISVSLSFEGLQHKVQLKVLQCQTPVTQGLQTIQEIKNRLSQRHNLKIALVPLGADQVALPWSNTPKSSNLT